MKCTLCGSKNSTSAKQCQLCGTALLLQSELPEEQETTILENEPLNQDFPLIYSRVGVFLLILFLLAMPWMFMADLLREPIDVKDLRKDFFSESLSTSLNNELWWRRKQQILQTVYEHRKDYDIGKQGIKFTDIPEEVALSILLDVLKITPDSKSGLALALSQSSSGGLTLHLNKYQKGIWPLSILLSLEIKSHTNKNGYTDFEFSRLRRGTRDVSPNLAWDYFGEELQTLRSLEYLASGLKNLEMENTRGPQESFFEKQISWEYQQRSFPEIEGVFPETLL
ncbi:MAG: hypothetical protein CMO81_10430 [Waddliaceae bacterium]|nr:hypothetical protein [Waddliaceae bacterium]